MKIGDLTVSRIGYGAMRVIEDPNIWGPPKDKANAHRVLRRAYELGALAEFQREGKVRHVGLSNVTVSELEQARKIVPIVSVQNRYNLGDRSSEDVLKACEHLGIAFLPWFPLGDGASLNSAKVKA